MELKLTYAAILSFAALVVASDAATTTVAPESSSSGGGSFMPPASTTCLAANFATGGDFLDCCPAPDANDGICTLIWCIRSDMTIRDSCDCGQVETACDQLSMFTGMVDGLSDACTAMAGCCEAGVTSNSDFASCTEDAIAMSNITIPDISSLVPGGVPDLDSAVPTTTTETTTSGATVAGGTATTVPEDGTKTTTAAPETDATTPVATGAEKGTSGAAFGNNVIGVALEIALIGTSAFALLFV